ncbi:MAG: D-sedoheptulose 7-phosphate isomerase [Phycisphaerales bacterium]|nr:D-sedoheptulose 7-phosphate isomerase [Phycisphaerales bacterium]
MSDAASIFRRCTSTAAEVLSSMRQNTAMMQAFANCVRTLCSALSAGHKVIVCGNGGSMCDAMHFAEELTGRFRGDRPALAAIAISDPSHLTCVANDYGFDQVFSRGVEALGQKGDVLVVLSTSGDSANIVRAVQAGRQRGLTTIALLGKSGGRLRDACDHQLLVPGETSDRIQELHMILLHAMVEAIEAEMFPAAVHKPA